MSAFTCGACAPRGAPGSRSGVRSPRHEVLDVPTYARTADHDGRRADAGLGGLAPADDGNGHSDHHASDSHQIKCDKSCGSQRYSSWDAEWLNMSIEGDLFEIQGGQIARQRGTTQQTKDLGATVVKDHARPQQDAIELAKKLGIEVPDSPSPSQQWELRVVQQFQGKDFDKWYDDLEVQDHVQDIQEHRTRTTKAATATCARR